MKNQITAAAEAAGAGLYFWLAQHDKTPPSISRWRKYTLSGMGCAMLLVALDDGMGRAVRWLHLTAGLTMSVVFAALVVDLTLAAFRIRARRRENEAQWAQMREGYQRLFKQWPCPQCGAYDLRVTGKTILEVKVQCAECRHIVEDVYMKIMESPD